MRQGPRTRGDVMRHGVLSAALRSEKQDNESWTDLDRSDAVGLPRLRTSGIGRNPGLLAPWRLPAGDPPRAGWQRQRGICQRDSVDWPARPEITELSQQQAG